MQPHRSSDENPWRGTRPPKSGSNSGAAVWVVTFMVLVGLWGNWRFPTWYSDHEDFLKGTTAGQVQPTPVTPEPVINPVVSNSAATLPSPPKIVITPTAQPSLDELKAACMAQVKNQAPSQMNQTRACDAYAARLKANRPPPQVRAPYPEVAMSERPVTTKPNVMQQASRPAVWVDDCSRHREGSINYRECRRREARRLNESCKDLEKRVDWASPDQYPRVKALRDATCDAYRKYAVMHL